VSKRFYGLLLPVLYETIVIEPDDQWEIRETIGLMAEARRKGHFHWTRHIEVREVSMATHLKACAEINAGTEHRRGLLSRKLANPRYHYPSETTGWNEMAHLLYACKDDNLTSVTFRMNHNFWGATSYLDFLAMRQRNIETLCFIVDLDKRGRHISIEPQKPVPLSCFKKLKRISWYGPATPRDYQVLAETLKNVSRQLEELEIGVAWASVAALRGGQEFAERILGLPKNEKSQSTATADCEEQKPPRITIFPCLRKLSLSCLSFFNPEDEVDPDDYYWAPELRSPAETPDLDKMMEAIDFPALTSLRLVNCPGWDKLLERLTKADKPLQLRSFVLNADWPELHHQYSGGAQAQHELMKAVVREKFLGSFEGLQDLVLQGQRDPETKTCKFLDLCKWALAHKKTLRRLVYLPRRWLDRGREYDLAFPALFQTQPNPLDELDLECLGLLWTTHWFSLVMNCVTSGPFSQQWNC